MARKAVLLVCDGLSREWISPERTPNIWRLKGENLWAARHTAVFPSVTRASAASIATGCPPGEHGLHGNRMCFLTDGSVTVRDAGLPDFRDHMRSATGRTLRVPTMAERLGGDSIAFSNVSPGAAYFLDPDSHGWVYHRAGSFAPGGVEITGSDALGVPSTPAGDREMVDRFCDEVLGERAPTLAICWQCSPDKTGHTEPLLGPDHSDALAAADEHVALIHRKVEALRADGDDVLLIVCSDHGMESVGPGIHIAQRLVDAGLKHDLESGDVGVAAQGTAALIYIAPQFADRAAAIRAFLEDSPWAGRVLADGDLTALGARLEYGLTFAIDMAVLDEPNGYNVPTRRYEAIDGPETDSDAGFAQHGGLGPRETAPFLIVNDGTGNAGTIDTPTSLTHIAPTIMKWLGQDLDGLASPPLL